MMAMYGPPDAGDMLHSTLDMLILRTLGPRTSRWKHDCPSHCRSILHCIVSKTAALVSRKQWNSQNRNLLPHAYLEIAGRLKQRPRRLAQLHIGELIRRLAVARIFRS